MTNAKKYKSIKSLIKSNKLIKKFKFDVFFSKLNSTSRVYVSINQVARTSQIAIDAISSLKNRFKLKTFKTKSSRSFEQKYIVAADVDHTNKDTRVETSLTNAKKYNSIKSSIKFSFKSLKSVAIISSFNSTFRFSLSVNHDSIMSQMLISMLSRIDLLRALIHKMIYVSILAFFRTMIHHCRRRFHTHLDIRVETTLKKTRK